MALCNEQLRPKKSLSFAEKIQVIELRQTFNTSMQKLANQFQCSTSQIKTILEERDCYFKKQSKNIVPSIVSSPTPQLVTTCEDLRLATCATQTASTSTHQPSLSASTKTKTTMAKSNIQLRRTYNRLSLAEKIQIIQSQQKFSSNVAQLAVQFLM